jgi:3-isopropylmalate dehydrogenase
VVRETSGLMVREARKIAKDYPGIELWETNIDAMCMWLIKNPQDYGVLVSSNMFGDIVSDLCAQLVGGLGFACSGNIGDEVAVFEPSHGSAPKYVGMNKVNPIAMILSAKMMLDHLDEDKLARRLEDAVAAVIAEGKVRTYDMGGSNTTTDMAAAVAAKC